MSLFDELWRSYAAITAQAQPIHTLVQARGEQIQNDHIALRTFNRGPIVGLDLARVFQTLGYTESGRYSFDQKRLDATSWSHPQANVPRVFISELRVQELSAPAQSIIDELLARIPTPIHAGDILRNPDTWPTVSSTDYETLSRESEYAAWVAAFGIRVNHFTVSVNALNSFADLNELNEFLTRAGFRLNGDDRPIQGGAHCGLEQSSTIADCVEWSFRDRTMKIPSCYYEFARRYPKPGESELYDGFVTESADRIFESTDLRHHRPAPGSA